MSFRLTSFGAVCSVAACAVGVAGGNVRAADSSPPARESIEFSDPKPDTALTNVNQLGKEANDMRKPDGSTGTGESFSSPASSPYGMLPSQRGVSGVIINKRAKDPLDALGNSGLKKPEDVMQEQLLREILRLPDPERSGQTRDRKLQPAFSMESLYDRALGRGAENRNVSQYYDATALRRMVEEANTFGRVEESKSSWAEDPFFGKNYLDSGAGPKNLFRGFGLDADNRPSELTPESRRAKAAQEELLKRFESLLNGSYDYQSAGTPQNAGVPANPGASGSAAPVSSESQQSSLLNPAGPGGTAWAPPTAPTAPVPGSLSTTPPLPARLPPLKPVFSVPQRGF